VIPGSARLAKRSEHLTLCAWHDQGNGLTIGGVGHQRRILVAKASRQIAASSEALAWACSSLRWARERDQDHLAALLEEVVTDLELEEVWDGSSPPHPR
jgi:hypothetical protein